jgi:hypothetical protein
MGATEEGRGVLDGRIVLLVAGDLRYDRSMARDDVVPAIETT